MREKTIATSRHVWQVAELVRRLDQDEIRELIRLVPRLQKEAIGERIGLVRWTREQMAQYADEARPMQGEDAFVGDMTVKAYFALPEADLVGYPLSVIAYCLACSTVTPRRSTNGRGAVALCLRGAQRASWLIPTSTSSISVATST